MALVLLNAQARGGRAQRLEPAMREWLRRHHPGTTLEPTHSAGEAARVVARADRGSRIVVIGGDGTLHHLLRPLLEGGHEVGLVPAGSGDDSARALGLRGLPWPRALSRALTGSAVAVDIGWVGTEHEERPFFSSLGAGFDAAIAQRALAGPRWVRGMPRYLLATLREIAALRLHEVSVELDGAAWYKGAALFVSALNTPSYGGGMPAVPDATIDDGRLDVLLAGRFGRIGALAMLPLLLTGHHLGHAQVHCGGFRTLRIEAAAPLPLAADGEAMRDARRIAIRVGQGVLRIVPAHDGLRASSSRTSRTTSRSSVSTE